MQTQIRRRGVAATSMNDVLTAGSVSAGSAYHHFPGGKDALAVAAVRRSGEEVEALLRDLLTSDQLVSTLLRQWTDLLAVAIEHDARDGCPVAPAAVEGVGGAPALRAAAAAAFDSWHRCLRTRLERDGLLPQDAEDRAWVALSAVEGALLLARTRGDVRPLSAVGAAFTPSSFLENPTAS